MPEEDARATSEMILVHSQQAERIEDAILVVVSEQPGIGFDNEPLFTPTSSFTQQVQRRTDGRQITGGGGAAAKQTSILRVLGISCTVTSSEVFPY
jgi:hypothetical protein